VPGTESAVTETPKPEQEIQNPAEASAQVPTESKGPDATPENPPESPTPPPST
jgi:hypothetical protein